MVLDLDCFEGLNILLTWHTLTSAETKNAYFCFTRKGKVRLGSNFDVFAVEFSISDGFSSYYLLIFIRLQE